jgi:3-hydroxybutyryl-CoA dehydrogenase
MPHRETSRKTIELVHDFAKRIGQIPIYLKKESHFYVFNAMYFALNRAAIKLVRNGVASIEDIDRSWMGITKMEIGPFGMLDGVGIDTACEICQYWAKEYSDPELQATADFLDDYADKGRLGIKSGQGFYTYPNPIYQQPGFLEKE